MSTAWHHSPRLSDTFAYVWEQKIPEDVANLVFSWNASRPKKGDYLFSVALLQSGSWTPFTPYASWGQEGQSSLSGPDVQMQQDEVLLPSEGAQAFRLRIEAQKGSSLANLRALHACTQPRNQSPHPVNGAVNSQLISVPELSQFAIPHEERQRLCSPASITALLHAMDADTDANALSIASKVWDSTADIYGNWSFAVAAMAETLGTGWSCWVDRLNGIAELVDILLQKRPVIISVKGPLPGGAQPYEEGHLLIAHGYDAETDRIRCMDPAFPLERSAYASYASADLDKAWSRRGYVACLAEKTA